MTLESWLLFCATETVLCLTPGPAVLLVVSLSVSRGLGDGLRANLGVLSANALYFALAATSLASALLASWHLFVLIKWCGAAYLIWLGVRMIFRSYRYGESEGSLPPKGRRAYLHGFVAQGSNPKLLVFFAAIVPQFIDPTVPLGFQMLVLGISSLVIELLMLAAYGLAANRVRSTTMGFSRAAERAGGALLIGAGAGLASLSRD